MAENGLMTLSGGKITDYRKMAAGALEMIRDILKKDFNETVREIDSKKLQVSGGHFDPNNVEETLKFYTKVAMSKGISEDDATDLANRFGSNVSRVVSYADQGTADGLNLKETISLRYSVNEEMTLTPVDYLLRRTNFVLFHNDQLAAIKQPVINEMARLLNWDAAEKERQTAQLDAAIAEAQLDYLK